ncbi:hypothetical protein ACHAWF_009196 [Thalassiosira exigua]
MSRNDVREVEPIRDAVHPLQRPSGLAIEDHLRQDGRAEQLPVLRYGIEVQEVGIVAPSPRVQLPPGHGALPQRPHGRVEAARFRDGPAERDDVDLRREEDESELDHAPPAFLSRSRVVHDDVLDGITRVEQQRAGVLLYDLWGIPRDTADAIRHDE